VKSNPAVLLSDGSSFPNHQIGKLLSFFGISWRTLRISQLLSDSVPDNCRIFSSAEILLRLLESCNPRPELLPDRHQNIHSIFVLPDKDLRVLEKLVRLLTRDEGAEVRDVRLKGEEFVIADDWGFCSVMAGIRIPASRANDNTPLVSNITNIDALSLISSTSGSMFLKLQYGGVPVFVSTSAEIIDIDSELTAQNFDVREHFLSTVPVVLYTKWAWAELAWRAQEIGACLTLDDPVLKPVYGFVNFRDLLLIMKRHNFSTSVAFIPWNWRRSSPKTVSLFRENPEYYSISVHGCDHTRAEFGNGNREYVQGKVREAMARMDRHESRTAVPHDRVMVFPQGVFSRQAINALKHSGFVAAVNNDTISADLPSRRMKIRELWDVAVMSYDNFPIFTRRYPWEGLENFAFDVLVGKPAIIVVHHDYFSDRYKRLVDFIDRLNALNCSLEWGSLGEVVRRSCRQRLLSSGLIEMEMYGKELRLENRSQERKRYVIRRRESEPLNIKGVLVEGRAITWNFAEDGINFEIELDPGENKIVEVRFEELLGNGRYPDTLSYRAKAMLRRYLCEIRDNYVMPARVRLPGSC
jgi:hypothetical protein